MKQGHIVSNWKTRYFKLSNAVLIYYTDDSCSVEKGRILVDRYMLEEDSLDGVLRLKLQGKYNNKTMNKQQFPRLICNGNNAKRPRYCNDS